MNKETRSTFETLEAWKMARNLRKEIARLVKAFPQEEKFRLTDQMIRASRSITANIAEGTEGIIIRKISNFVVRQEVRCMKC